METGEDTTFQDFEDFLKDSFMVDEPESVGNKDTFDDNFDDWLNRLETSEWLEYGAKFSRLSYGVQEMPQMKGTKEALDKITIR